MVNKLLPTGVLICASFLLVSTASHACDKSEQSLFKQEKTALSDLNRAGAGATLYNYRTQRCTPLANAHNELQISAFLPSDETSLGMYQVYRDKGESQVDALEHTLAFVVGQAQR